MKKLFIIDCYPSGKREKNILLSCIFALKRLQHFYDIMIVSHLPIDSEIAEKVEYVIYDHNNNFLSPRLSPNFFLTYGELVIRVFNQGHSLPICRNMNTSLHMAQCLGYEEFVFLESDVVLHHEDLELLDSYMVKMNSDNKKMLFFKPQEYRDVNNSYVYETLLFGGNVDYFLKSFIPPMNEEQWLTTPMGYTLELSFFERFSRDEQKFLIVEDHSSKIFNKSAVNLSRFGLFCCDILYNQIHEDAPTIFIMNSLIEETFKYTKVFKNGELIHATNLGNTHFWLNTFPLDGSEIEVLVYDDMNESSLFLSKKFLLTKEFYENCKNKGIINTK